MNARTLLTERRSIRRFKDETVSREVMNEIMELTKFAPSWANLQVARYTFIDNEEVIKDLATNGVDGFVYNVATLENAKGVLALSYVKGKSGKSPDSDSPESTLWEVFDAGIAAQQFSLAAYSKGVGSVIMGVINAEKIAEIINLPSDEKIAALIVYGYEEEHPNPTPRKSVEEITRYI